jgi:hypothetical protein
MILEKSIASRLERGGDGREVERRKKGKARCVESINVFTLCSASSNTETE